MSGRTVVCLITFLGVGLTAPASADQRQYVWTYEYQTMARGAAEVEAYVTLAATDTSRWSDTVAAEHQLELEVGMNDRFDVGIYQVFTQAPGEGFRYEGFKVRGRYRIGEKGAFFFDPLFYLEYKGVPTFRSHEIEIKFIAARDFGPVNLALNPAVEAEWEDGWEVWPAYAVGVGWRPVSLFAVGGEAHGDADAHYLGPAVSHGNERFWVTVGYAYGLGVPGDRDEAKLRMLLGVGL